MKMNTPTHLATNYFRGVQRNLNVIFDKMTVVKENTAKAVPKKSPQDKVIPKKRHPKNIKHTNAKKLSAEVGGKMPRRRLFTKTTSVLENLKDSSGLSSEESRFSGGGSTAAQA